MAWMSMIVWVSRAWRTFAMLHEWVSSCHKASGETHRKEVLISVGSVCKEKEVSGAEAESEDGSGERVAAGKRTMGETRDRVYGVAERRDERRGLRIRRRGGLRLGGAHRI
jgi:hypothetical protein